MELLIKKRRQTAIRGLFIDGEWVTDPRRVKDFVDFYGNLFAKPDWSRPSLLGEFPRVLDSAKRKLLEEMVSKEEIKKAVWDCGSDKSPGPDGFTFEFFKKFAYC